FQVLFNLKRVPKTGCRLILSLVSTQNVAPPAVTVTVNGHACDAVQLPGGSGDGALGDPKAGRPCQQPFLFPSSWLVSGKNEIVIATVGGSWMLFDAVKLDSGISNTPEVSRIEAVCTPMFKTVDGSLRQAVRVRVENDGLAGPGTLALTGEGGVEQAVEIGQGTGSLVLLVPPFVKAERRKVTLKAGDKEVAGDFDARPERQWTLYVAASAHTDIGYTDLQEKCIALHVDNTVAGLDAAAANPDFKWNLEVFSHYDWFKELKPERAADLDRQIQERRVGLTGLYLNMLTGLCSGPEMMRVLEPAQRTGRALGVPVEMASLNDVPSSVGTLPMFLRHAGVRYFAEAINQDRGPVFMHCDPEMNQSPFWWESPDGSRVMAMFTRTYFQVSQIRLHESVAAVEESLPRFMETFMREGYPGDAIFINGAFLDNCAMTPRYADVAAEWNKTWDYPKFVLATADEYFRHIEENFGNDLPVYRGDMGSFWEDGAASSAAETGMVRWAKNTLSTAEKWEALAGLRGLDGATPGGFGAIWRDILYYDEHTWGSAGSISDPNNPQSTGQWTRKAAFANNALDKSRATEQDSGLVALRKLSGAAAAEDGRAITVSNPLSWTRDVPVVLPADVKGDVVRDKVNGKREAAQRAADGGLFFVAEAVPAMGWRTFEVASGSAGKEQSVLRESGDPGTWMTDRFSFHISGQTGGLDRVTDLATGREWVDAASGYHMNQFLHVAGGNGTAMIHPGHKPVTDLLVSTHEAATVTLVENGPARAVLHIARQGAVSPVDTDLVIHRDGTFDFVNVIHKVETLEKEAGYFVFPFGLNTPDRTSALMELPYGIVAADQEQMPGACREWYSVNTFAAVDNGAQSACVAACDTPLFTVGGINRGLWPSRNPGNRHLLFAYVYNNYWHTNYKASQGGDIRCAFSVKLSENPFDAADATRFGWGRTLDLTPGAQNAVRSARLHGPAKQSLVALDDGPVLLSELLTLDGGGRMLARLYNPSAMAAETSIGVQGVRVAEMSVTDLFGEHGTPLPVDGKVTVPARGIATVVLQAR
ncbi:MAG: hypothetical protein QG656_256, partial [Candidatus Hydrogenedentes bacterium]|nr:hypothetical protein [Candidatus Hydrogenedentota bacterium]